MLVLAASLYSLSAIACFFIEGETGVPKLTGTIGFAVLLLVTRYCFGQNKRLALGLYGFIGIALATLLAIPNAYWAMPLVSFTRIVYEDNLAEVDTAGVLRTPYGYGGRLALDDGRLLIQTQHIPVRPRYRGQSDTPTYSNGVVVALEPVTATKPGRWFEIQHYDREYVHGAYYNGQRARYVLGLAEEHVNLYRRSIRTLGFLVDESAPVSSEGIDLRSPQFLDRAFATEIEPHGLIGLWPLGMSPVAQDSRGNTILHFAAARCDGLLLAFLSDKAIDPTLRNGEGRTALEIVAKRAADDPGRCPAAQRYFEEQTDAAGRKSPAGQPALRSL
jgi:hypothetical protein